MGDPFSLILLSIFGVLGYLCFIVWGLKHVDEYHRGVPFRERIDFIFILCMVFSVLSIIILLTHPW